MRSTFLAVLTLLALSNEPALAEGQLMVLPASLALSGGHERSVTVKNMGDAPLYLNIALQKVSNPGLEPEHKVSLSDIDQPDLLATPDKMTLGPGQSRRVNLKSLKSPENEEIYRLYVVPTRAIHVEEAPKDQITAPMSVAIGYGVLVRHLPALAQQHHAWSYKCVKGEVVLENTGNVRQIFSNVEAPGKQKIRKLAIFPGTPHHFESGRLSMMVDSRVATVECPK